MKELNLDVQRIMQLLKDAGEKTEHCVAYTHKTAVSVTWQLQLLNRHHFNFNLCFGYSVYFMASSIS